MSHPMTTFERRQTILRLLQEQTSVHVTELARLLDVSEGTIRNDLTALEESRLVVRVRGGAVLRDDQPAGQRQLRCQAAHRPVGGGHGRGR